MILVTINDNLTRLTLTGKVKQKNYVWYVWTKLHLCTFHFLVSWFTCSTDDSYQNVLKKLIMDKIYLSTTPMII
jgi:hypothetical protein